MGQVLVLVDIGHLVETTWDKIMTEEEFNNECNECDEHGIYWTE